jgi:hypothetical protein
MPKADANFQKSFLRKSRRDRILAVDDGVLAADPPQPVRYPKLPLKSFIGVTSSELQNAVIFYKLFLGPPDNPSGEEDKFEVKQDGSYQEKVNEIANIVKEMPRPLPVAPTTEVTANRKECGKYLNVMYFAFHPYCILGSG